MKQIWKGGELQGQKVGMIVEVGGGGGHEAKVATWHGNRAK